MPTATLLPIGTQVTINPQLKERRELRHPKTKQLVANYVAGLSYRVTTLNQVVVSEMVDAGEAVVGLSFASPGTAAADRAKVAGEVRTKK